MGAGLMIPPRRTSAYGPQELLTPGEVAKLFRVDPKTVTRWAKGGRIKSIRLPGGHRRYRAGEVTRFLREEYEGSNSAVEQISAMVEGQQELPGTTP